MTTKFRVYKAEGSSSTHFGDLEVEATTLGSDKGKYFVGALCKAIIKELREQGKVGDLSGIKIYKRSDDGTNSEEVRGELGDPEKVVYNYECPFVPNTALPPTSGTVSTTSKVTLSITRGARMQHLRKKLFAFCQQAHGFDATISYTTDGAGAITMDSDLTAIVYFKSEDNALKLQDSLMDLYC